MALVRSLRARVVLWVSVALVVLFAATGVVLDVAFRNSMDQARRELLEVQVLGLIALADDSSGELTLPTDGHHIDSQFEVANSGPLRRALFRRRPRRLAIARRCSAAISRSTISPWPAKSGSSASTCRVSRRSNRC